MVVLFEPSAEMRDFLISKQKHSVPEKAFMFAIEQSVMIRPEDTEADLEHMSQ